MRPEKKYEKVFTSFWTTELLFMNAFLIHNSSYLDVLTAKIVFDDQFIFSLIH